MADTSGRHLLVTFLVTRDGERGHPMDTVVKRVNLADDGTPTPATLDRLVESIAHEVVRKAATERSDPDMPTLTDPLLLALNAERLRQGLTMQAWAERAGVNVNTVHRLVRGERLGHMSVVRHLAYALGLELCIRPLSKEVLGGDH